MKNIFILILLALPCFSGIYINPQSNVTNGLVAWWKLDEINYDGTAGEVKDSSGNGNNGTTYGKIITNPSKLGRAALFNDSRFSVTGPINEPENHFTVSLWLRCKYGIAPYAVMGNSLYHQYGFSILTWVDGYIGYAFNTSGDSIERMPVIYADNELFHLSIVKNGNHILTYKNGELKDDYTLSITYTPSLIEMRVGGTTQGGWSELSTGVNGDIDDVRIYNRALSSNEVVKLYNLGTPKKEAVTYNFSTVPYELLSTNGLVAHWKLDELSYSGTPGEVKDSSGNGNNADSYKTVLSNPAKIGRGAYFDGSGSSIWKSSMYLTTNFTICGWANIKNVSNNGLIFGFESRSYPQRAFFTSPPNAIYYSVYDYDPDTSTPYGGSGPMVDAAKDNQWYFLAMSSTNFITSVYVDGVFVASQDYHSYKSTLEWFSIGSFAYWNWLPNSVMIDDVRIYNRALSSNEISQIYNAAPLKSSARAMYQGTQLVSNPLKKTYPKDVWSPLMIPDCQLLLNADNLSSSTVSEWVDQSTNHVIFTPVSGSIAPTLETGLGGNKVVRFNRTGDRNEYRALNSPILPASYLASGSATMFVVANIIWYSDRGSEYNFIEDDQDGWGRYYGDARNYPSLFIDGRLETYCVMPYMGAHIFETLAASTGYRMSVDGVFGSTKAYTYQRPNRLYIGGDIINSGGKQLIGDICEIVIYNRELSQAERQRVSSYLQNKWKLSLPPESN